MARPVTVVEQQWELARLIGAPTLDLAGLKALVVPAASTTVRLLDVGSGPVRRQFKSYPGRISLLRIPRQSCVCTCRRTRPGGHRR